MSKIDLKHFSIIPLKEEGLAEVLEIENCSFPTPWTRKIYVMALASPQTRIFLLKNPAAKNFSLIGYICLYFGHDTAHLLKIATSPRLRRQGFATHLLDFALEVLTRHEISELLLEVREHNHPARCFYEKFGFQLKGIIPNYYHDTDENALVMGLDFYKLCNFNQKKETLRPPTSCKI